VILKPDRTLNFATRLARRLLAEYFAPPRADERLPEALDLWVRQHDASTRDILRLPLPRSPLVIERDGKRLVLCLLSGNGELAIVLEEQKTIIEPSSLGSLSLTRREREVLAHIANGHNNSETARALGIGTRTVETHILHICERLGVSSRLAAAAHAFQASRAMSLESRNDAEPQAQLNRRLKVDSEN
jgi:DNA-binding CsgD family transcriptional regulator